MGLTLRELRLWHWRQVMLKRQQAALHRMYFQDEAHARSLDKQANFHIKAVQALNDAPGCENSTAEQDDRRE